jgi:hypothetical protein
MNQKIKDNLIPIGLVITVLIICTILIISYYNKESKSAFEIVSGKTLAVPLITSLYIIAPNASYSESSPTFTTILNGVTDAPADVMGNLNGDNKIIGIRAITQPITIKGLSVISATGTGSINYISKRIGAPEANETPYNTGYLFLGLNNEMLISNMAGYVITRVIIAFNNITATDIPMYIKNSSNGLYRSFLIKNISNNIINIDIVN